MHEPVAAILGSDHFSKGAKSYWVPYEAFNEADKAMKVIFLLFFEYMIPCMVDASRRKKVFLFAFLPYWLLIPLNNRGR